MNLQIPILVVVGADTNDYLVHIQGETLAC